MGRTLSVLLRSPWEEQRALRLLNWMVDENARILRRRPELPLLYDSGVVYRREASEVWQLFPQLLEQGHEDCDSLAAARAGELRARGWRALKRGDAGWEEAQRRRPRRIEAEVILTTRAPEGQVGSLYHCIVRYRLHPAGRWYRDDPSARLGMHDGKVSVSQWRRWKAAGVAA